jgi:hypothetical protein
LPIWEASLGRGFHLIVFLVDFLHFTSINCLSGKHLWEEVFILLHFWLIFLILRR